jgi:multidrug efflux pump subunit AcrB
MRANEIYSFNRIECLDGIWSRLDGAPCNMIAFNDFLPFFAGDKSAVPGTWQTMIFAMISCLCLCLLFIPSITIVGVIVFCIGFLLIGILGFTYYLDYRLDSVTQTLFIMGIGFAVDFTVHVSHAFLQATGTRVEKVVAAVEIMGEAVFLASASSILGVALLFSSSSVILIGLAAILSVIMIIGLFIAGILLPTILAIIGPSNPPSQLSYIESVTEHQDSLEMSQKIRSSTPPTSITPELN